MARRMQKIYLNLTVMFYSANMCGYILLHTKQLERWAKRMKINISTLSSYALLDKSICFVSNKKGGQMVQQNSSKSIFNVQFFSTNVFCFKSNRCIDGQIEQQQIYPIFNVFFFSQQMCVCFKSNSRIDGPREQRSTHLDFTSKFY